MRKHLIVSEYGRMLGLSGERLVVREKNDIIAEYPLNRLKTVSLDKAGVSISSNLLLQCAARGIRVFVLDYRGQATVCVSGSQEHAMVNLRKNQFRFLESEKALSMAAAIVRGKIRNQRAVLLYFSKGMTRNHPEKTAGLREAAEALACLAGPTGAPALQAREKQDWRAWLMGMEGQAAATYWQQLRHAGLMPQDFMNREKKGAQGVTNGALNYGYAILNTAVWHALLNAGLEVYAGCLHVDRPGRPGLVLDLMEEFRAWCVDRVIIKNRQFLTRTSSLEPPVRKRLVADIQETLASRYPFGKKHLTLEGIIQRQAYRMAGAFSGEASYKPYAFRW